MQIETEVKFNIPDLTIFTALKNTTRLGDFQLRPLNAKTYADRYLDSADRRLFQAGYACRIRSVEHKQILTLKSLTPPQDKIHRRREIELEVATDQPQAWGTGEAKELVLTTLGEQALHTLFTIYQTRYKYDTYLQNEPVIELSLDEVSTTEAGRADYFELEAELKGPGTEKVLYQFTDVLLARWDLRPESRSKFERALDNQYGNRSKSL